MGLLRTLSVQKMLARRILRIWTPGGHGYRFASTTALKEKRAGVIGLGMVGNALVKNLQRTGYNVTTILDVDPEKYKDFSCLTAKTPLEVANAVDVVFTALPMPQHVKAVFEGEEGLLAGLTEGKVWIDHSTTDYEQLCVGDRRPHADAGDLRPLLLHRPAVQGQQAGVPDRDQAQGAHRDTGPRHAGLQQDNVRLRR